MLFQCVILQSKIVWGLFLIFILEFNGLLELPRFTVASYIRHDLSFKINFVFGS